MAKLQELYVRMLVELGAARKGQGLVEYVLIVALISVVALGIMTTVGGQVETVFERVSTALATGLAH